ncbi:MAG TPA: 16S rRNA (cytosine(1402)-N(4))-methyltransferase RsmH [Candidatus Saccharibacteria bacterium]|nr:16S rRNA (cytosine(1402)-N(4))-methyltransferase RsmH [Candidatus Saccharibacteria bacterium]HMT55643.1 16S rRNA (cytosine(1402)-N(4))-methyltransferase RsmH [Candidatus Saccharibacteria bacterium]
MSQTKIKNKTILHVPVLLQEVVMMLTPVNGERYLDLTAGYGGHAQEMLKHTEASATLVDRDEHAIAVLSDMFEQDESISILHMDFKQAVDSLVEKNEIFDIVLADLGVSSPHLDKASRGFSLASEGPLDMRMDPSQSKSAYEVVNSYEEAELERILRVYGEEPKARAMARLIVASRPIETTLELAQIAKKIWPGHSRSHPATRLFQAIRIEVNDELAQVEAMLPQAVKLLKPGGRLGIITFHSLEDRLVKQFFKQVAGDRYDTDLEEITKGPVTASQNELVNNPRARSAKLRGVRKRK